MFSRNRSSRSSHGTAYTGVSQNTNNKNKPNSGALAAALTIGNAMKQQNGSSDIPRSQSFQYRPPNPQQRVSSLTSSNESLLKRGSRSNFQSPQAHAAPQRRFSNGSFSSQGSNRGVSSSSQAAAYYNSQHPEIYDIDDSFNDSYLDEITEESTQVYLNNKANMQDLRLPTANSGSQSRAAAASAPVRMVKKYVPSPTGIKVIEVPESTFQKELARSNSMRLNPISSRSNSLRNTANKKPPSRASSLNSKSQHRPVQQVRNVSTPSKMQSMSEDVNLEDSLGRLDTNQAQQAKLRALEKEIEHEKQLAKELELKRLEYQRLREQNLATEKKQREIEDLSTKINTVGNKKEFSSTSDDDYIPIIEKTKAVDELDKKKLDKEEVGDDKTDVLGESSKDHTQIENQVGSNEIIASTEEEADDKVLAENSPDVVDPDHKLGVTSSPSDDYVDPHRDTVDSDDSLDEDLGNVRVAVVVENSDVGDESIPKPSLDNLGSDIEVVSDYDDEAENNPKSWETDESERLDADSEMRVIAQYGMTSTDVVNEVSEPSSSTDAAHLDNNAAENVTTAPQILESHADEDRNTATINSKVESADTLLPPAVATASSSKSSIYSNDSTKRPIKSAMKSSSSYSHLPHKQGPPPAQQNSNAARQAYLSLTTAENTRLNSKLSNPQLPPPQFSNAKPHHQVVGNDLAYLGASNGGAYPQFSTSPQLQKPPTKRLSQQTLRKQQPQQQQFQQQQQQPTQFRSSMRPQSMAGRPGQQAVQPQKPPTMSNRSLRNSTYVQPIAPHPALQKNYVSPAKVKAADLYAKAQARPYSDFKPLKKKSSFSKESGDDVPPRSPSRGQNPVSQSKPQPRTTLRDLADPSTVQNTDSQKLAVDQNASNGQTGRGGFTSRFGDSDDDLPLRNGTADNRGFKSRFNDSDENLPRMATPAAQSSPQKQPGFATMRAEPPNEVQAEAPKEKKKKFGGKLRKLFQSKN
ncbi:hypothetical protein CANMA_003471 [Candida margitis]|uniref:uncharacterized protein n=1 Tax=Candida margitis TaxID=1775924 RepID=UPI0022275CF3|nr:uncharacterized protein CANMA_003471 [Candida margitis]KAI5964961.1 hypothetical protein CANMA_003471 [Candida margitis]